MTCIHNKQASEKVNELIRKMNDADSSLYEKLGKYVSEEEVDALLNTSKTSCTVRTINTIRRDDLYNHLSVIFDILKSCECRNEIAKEYNELAVKSSATNCEKNIMQLQVASLQTRTEHYLSQLTDTRQMLENKVEAIIRLENRLEGKDSQIDNLRNRLSDLKLDNSAKVGEF